MKAPAKVLAIEFQHTAEGFKYESIEDFEEDAILALKDVLDGRMEMFKDKLDELDEEGDSMFPTLPMTVYLLFEDYSGASTLLWPQNSTEKEYLMNGVKGMMEKYNKSKKIIAGMLVIEAWFTEIDLKQRKKDNPFFKELTDEQISMRASREFQQNEVPKTTKIILELQTPAIASTGAQYTKVKTKVFDLFEHKILIPDDKTTAKLNEVEVPDKDTPGRADHFCMFTPIPEKKKSQYAEDGAGVLNFNFVTATKYLQNINKYLK